jgi:peroxin-6
MDECAPLDPGVSLPEVARRVPQRFTGADMYALCADAWMRAAKRLVLQSSSSSPSASSSSIAAASSSSVPAAAAAVVVIGDDFLSALAELTPSLTDKDVAHYLRLRQSFEGGLSKSKGAGGGR